MVDNARRAVRIYGPDVLLLKGKTTRGDAVHIPTQVPSPLPLLILEDHANVTLCANFFHARHAILSHNIKEDKVSHSVSCEESQM